MEKTEGLRGNGGGKRRKGKGYERETEVEGIKREGSLQQKKASSSKCLKFKKEGKKKGEKRRKVLYN